MADVAAGECDQPVLTAVVVAGTSARTEGERPDSACDIAALTGTVARAGKVVLVGMGGDEVRLPLSYLQDRELVVTGAFRYANTWPTAIGLVASGRVDLDAMVTGLAEVESALTAARSDPTVLKAIVRPRE